MAELEDSKAQNLELQGDEETLTDKDIRVFDTIILNGSIEVAQAKLTSLQS